MEPLDELVGESPEISAVRDQVRRLLERQGAARRQSPVLILGETGTGKGLLARALHRTSARAQGPFVSVNCAALPDALLESELFGFERGAFTGADRAKDGLFHVAEGGMLFLDEISALPFALQAKLLTAIEDRTVRRLGSTHAHHVNVWILAAANEDLRAAVQNRRFREDLYHRLSTIVISLPPLRERGADVAVLAEHFLAAVCRDYGLPPKRLGADAHAALRAYPWPGNVRELANVMERVAVLDDEAVVSAQKLGLLTIASATVSPEPGRSLKNSLEELERSQLLAAMETSRGNVSRAAVLLGLSRNTLRYRLAKYRLGKEAAPKSAAPEPGPGDSSAKGGLPVTFLWARLDPSRDASSRRDGEFDVIWDKVQAFGGRFEEIEPTGVVASFRIEPLADSAVNALHAALAMKKAVEREQTSPQALRLKALIHVAECDLLDPISKERALSALHDMAAAVEPDAILVSSTASPALRDRFTLVPLSTNPGGRGLARVVSRTPPIIGRPSIAILPFRNLTGDSDQEYFGDGITEAIIGALSRFRWLFVITRSSTLVYRDREVGVPQIATELAVRYLVTGTVRKIGGHLRVTADLIDAEASTMIWTEHYDGTLADIFDFQDRITARIAGTLDARLRVAEIQRAMQKRADSLDEYGCVLRAMSLIHRLSKEGFPRADELLKQAISLDPKFSTAYAIRAWWYLAKVVEGWSTEPDADIAEAGRVAETALEHDGDDAMALAISGHVAVFFHRDYEKALRRFERSLALNPNSAFTWGVSAATFCYVGQPGVALDRVTYALRLSPFDPMSYFFFSVAGIAEMLNGRYEEAVVWAQKSRAENPRYAANLRKLAACLAQLGRLDEARDVARDFLATQTDFTISEFRRRYPLRDQAVLELYAANLGKAGLPE